MNMDHQPFCSVIIPAFNEAENIEKTLQSLKNQSYLASRFEIIVVDNGSTDDTVGIAKKYTENVFVKKDCNVGGVRNFGESKSKGEIVITTDADCTFSPNWLKNGVKILEDNKNLIAGGGLAVCPSANWVERLWTLNPEGKTVQQKDLMGSCIFIRKEAFEHLGKFPENVTSGEDSLLSKKAKSSGYTIKLFPELSVYHLGTPKSLKAFIIRQAWHGENGHDGIRDALKDKVLLATIAYIIFVSLSLISVGSNYFYLFIVFSQLVATSLSIKRINRSQYKPTALEFMKIIIIDNCYLIGRSIGLARILKNSIVRWYQ